MRRASPHARGARRLRTTASLGWVGKPRRPSADAHGAIDGGVMPIELRYIDRVGASEDNAFIARMDGDVVLIVAQIRRTDVSDRISIVIPAWVDARGRKRPPYDRPLFAIYRHDEHTWRLPGVMLAPGDSDGVWLMDVPIEVSAFW